MNSNQFFSQGISRASHSSRISNSGNSGSSPQTPQTRMDRHSAADDGLKPLVRAAVMALMLMLMLMMLATPAAAQQPTVSLLTPSNGQSFIAGASASNIYLSARAIGSASATITRVDFYSGTTLIGSDTTPVGSNVNGIYEYGWLNVPLGSYSITARATDSAGQITASTAVSITVVANQAPQVTLNTSAGPYTAQASILLSATASDADGRVAAVRFYNGGTLIGSGALISGTASNGTWNLTWGNVTAGAYVVTAQASDNLGLTVASNQMQITVNPAAGGTAPGMYFVEVDHLNTPRRIANMAQQTAWKIDNTEAFGDSSPNENPSALGAFTFPLRFPGQYYDQETGLSQNFHREYWAGGGRYVQFDPIGLADGINGYMYGGNDPLSTFDPFGLFCAFVANGYNPKCSATGVTRQKRTGQRTDAQWYVAPDPSATPDMSTRRPRAPWPGAMARWREMFYELGYKERELSCTMSGMRRCWDDCTKQLISEMPWMQDVGNRWEKISGSDYEEFTGYGKWKDIKNDINPDDLPPGGRGPSPRPRFR